MAEETGSAPAGNPSFDWKATLGESFDKHAPMLQAKGWDKKGPDAILTGYSELEKMSGRDKAALIEYERNKPPSDPNGYEFQAPADFEEYDKEFVNSWYRGAAHKAGLSTSQAKALHDAYVEQTRQAYSALKDQTSKEDKEADQALRAKWGGDYEKNMGLARAAVKEFGFNALALTELEHVIQQVSGSPTLLEMFATIGEKMGTASLVTGDATNNSTQGALSEIEKLKGDKDFSAAYLNREHPGHDEAVRRMRSLNAQAFPDAG